MTDIAEDDQSGDARIVPISRKFIWTPDKEMGSGIYLVKATTNDGNCITKRIVYLR